MGNNEELYQKQSNKNTLLKYMKQNSKVNEANIIYVFRRFI